MKLTEKSFIVLACVAAAILVYILYFNTGKQAIEAAEEERLETIGVSATCEYNQLVHSVSCVDKSGKEVYFKLLD